MPQSSNRRPSTNAQQTDDHASRSQPSHSWRYACDPGFYSPGGCLATNPDVPTIDRDQRVPPEDNETVSNRHPATTMNA